MRSGPYRPKKVKSRNMRQSESTATTKNEFLLSVLRRGDGPVRVRMYVLRTLNIWLSYEGFSPAPNGAFAQPFPHLHHGVIKAIRHRGLK